MLRRHLVLAFRVFIKHSLSSFIAILGLSTGIGCFLVLSLYLYNEYNTDRFHTHYEKIYQVDMQYYVNEEPMFKMIPPVGLQDDLANVLSIETSTRTYTPGKSTVRAGNKKFLEDGVLFADSSWLEVFSFRYLNSNFSFLTEPLKVAISSRMAEKYFGTINAVGKVIEINGETYQVENVLLQSEGNSSVEVNFLASFQRKMESTTEMNSYQTGHTPYFIVLTDNDVVQATQDIQNLIDHKLDNPPLKIELTSLNQFYFGDNSLLKKKNDGIRGNEKVYYAFSIIAVLILIVAAINYINLATARATDRSKEIGIKKTIGVSKVSLMFQFQCESFALTFLSGILAIGLTELLLFYFNQIVVVPIDDSVLLSFQFLSGYTCGLFILSVLTGLYPSLVLSSFKPISAVKSVDSAMGGRLWVRNTLITLQFVITTILIFGSVAIMRQMYFLSDFDLGFDSEKILSIETTEQMKKSYRSIKTNLLGIQEVERVSVGNLPGIGWMYAREFGDETVNVAIQKVDEDFLDMAGLTLLEGRALTATDAGSNNIIINKTMRDLLFGTDETSFGKLPNSESFVVGVVDDFEFNSARSGIMPLEIAMYQNEFENILLRIDNTNNIKLLIGEIEKVLRKHAPDDVMAFNFLDEVYNDQFKSEQTFLALLKSFTFISVLIGAIGLFGLAQFAFVKNLKNISIKKILGASDLVLIKNLLSALLTPVLIALLIGLPIGYYLMSDWLMDFTNRINMDWSLFGVTVVAVIAISLLTMLYQLLGAVLLKPIHALKDD
ncbi:MAG: ABC transporter permease [Bacteroidota bacterium]